MIHPHFTLALSYSAAYIFIHPLTFRRSFFLYIPTQPFKMIPKRYSALFCTFYVLINLLYRRK